MNNLDIETPTPPDYGGQIEEEMPQHNPPSRRRTAIFVVAFLAAVALIVGLSVGLTQPGPNQQGSLEEPDDRDGGDSGDGDEGSADPEGEDDFGKQDTDNKTISTDPVTEQTISQLLFQPKLRSFSDEILSGYTDCSTLVQDIEEAGKYLVNIIIADYIRYGSDGDVIALDDGMEMESAPEAAAGDKGSKASSYDTNNQVEGVDEADIVKSDGTNVFLAYGNDLVRMNINGTIISRFSAPEGPDSFPKIPHWDIQPSSSSSSTSSESSPSFTVSSMGDYWWGPPEQRISGLLLDATNNELIVIVSYYSSHEFKFISGDMTASHTYSIKESTLELKKTLIHKGRYETARFITDTAHVATRTNINSYPLREAMNRYNFPGMDDEEYRKAAYNRAVLLLPKYAKQLLAELISDENGTIDTASCARIIGVSDMSGVAGGDDDEEEDIVANDPTSGQGLMNGFARTVSFSSSGEGFVESGAFVPSYDLEVYANEDYLVLAGRGWVREPNTWNFLDYTYLMQFQLTAGAAQPHAIGKVKGRFLNQFSIDEYNNYLRIATTLNAQWGYDEEENTWKEITPSSSQIYILQKQQNGSLLKQVAILDNLGVNEDIYSVRFFQDYAFVVTFRRIDPFFTIDLSNPLKPTVAGELKIPGYSNYLHPIMNNKFVLAVGQHANETTGQNMGLQISLFNVTNFTNPTRIHNTVIEGWSWSDSQSDHLSFRYFDNTLIIPVEVWNVGAFENSYDGFYVYNVDLDNGIKAQGKVTHATKNYMDSWCWSDEYIPSRSMVFEGRLMTMKGHSIIMSDGLVQPNEEWSLNLDANRNKTNDYCYGWFAW